MSVAIVTYQVKELLTGDVKYTGTKTNCAKYLDKHPHLWLTCDIVPDSSQKASAVSMDTEWED